jgi:hypothetical protein
MWRAVPFNAAAHPADQSQLNSLLLAAAVVQERAESGNPAAAAASSSNPAVAAGARSAEEELLERFLRDRFLISDPVQHGCPGESEGFCGNGSGGAAGAGAGAGASFASPAAAKEEEDTHECCICLQNDSPDGEQDGGARPRLVTLPPPCRQPVHAECLAEWILKCRANRLAVTCPMCRQDLGDLAQ